VAHQETQNYILEFLRCFLNTAFKNRYFTYLIAIFVQNVSVCVKSKFRNSCLDNDSPLCWDESIFEGFGFVKYFWEWHCQASSVCVILLFTPGLFYSAAPFKKKFFNAAPLIDSVDANDTCKCPIKNLKRYFCLWWNHTVQTHTIHESNYTVIKLPRNGNSKAKKLTKQTIQFI